MSDLGDRMKGYEGAHDFALPPRMPIIVRVDGRAFHTLTRGCVKPFDVAIGAAMDSVAAALLAEIHGAKIAYVQSDEVSVLVRYHAEHNSQPWFGNRLQKMCSIAGSVASVAFARNWDMADEVCLPVAFDARAFVIPDDDVTNYFLWRQRDCERNSILSLAHSLAGPKAMHGLNTSALQELCWKHGKNWNDLETYWKRGRCVRREAFEVEPGTIRTRFVVDREMPRLGAQREYIERFLREEKAA